MQGLTRRDVVRGSMVVVAGAVLAGPAAVATANAARSGTPHEPQTNASRPLAASAAQVLEPFNEMYLGRHIEGWPADEDHGTHAAHGSHGGTRPSEDSQISMGFVVRVDDDDLHIMQNADGTWISVINHYETHRTPRDAARAAVRELHGATLVPVTV
ncbi:tyrosinase family oxidase copper chaperone [Streptomyces sp. NPDC060064]|uniref:apotyrosinase chaperone MelC1 n=1 Tax=Streptomyces sp. NPDC060064 TaxID=3347049 RepID=UPI0036B3B49A